MFMLLSFGLPNCSKSLAITKRSLVFKVPLLKQVWVSQECLKQRCQIKEWKKGGGDKIDKAINNAQNSYAQ